MRSSTHLFRHSLLYPLLYPLLSLSALTFGGCTGSSPSTSAGEEMDQGTLQDQGQGGAMIAGVMSAGDMDPSEPECLLSRPPLVLAHGFLASGDTWSRHVRRLTALGSCPDQVRTFDWNSLNQGGDHVSELEALIDQLLMESGATQVDLVGHSAGGGLGYSFLSDEARAQKVRRYVHIASFPNEGPAGPEGAPTPTLNLWSLSDLTVEGADIPNATNVTLNDEDHYGVATSFASFQALYSFLYDEEVDEDPLLSLEGRETLQLEGRVLTLGENQALPDASVALWSLDEQGARVERQAELSLSDEGWFQTPPIPSGARYELAPQGTGEGAPQVRYFTPALTQDDPLLYLRVFPGPGTLASLLVSQLPQEEGQVSLVVFNAHQAFLAGRDSLTLNGQELLTPEVASAEDTAIALFIFDVNGDGEPGGTLPLFESFPFLSVVDLPLDPQAQGPLTLELNGVAVPLPRVASSEATLITVFP